MARSQTTQRTFAVLIALAVAAALIYLGVPRTLAAFDARPGNTILWRIQRGATVSTAAVRALMDSRRQALAWSADGRYWTEMALAQLLLARAEPGTEDGHGDLARQAARALEQGLARSPIDPHAWTRLAYARSLLEADPRAIAAPLMMSISVGPHEPKLVFVRLRLCLGVWRHLSTDERAAVARQVRYAWKRSKRKLLELAADSGNYTPIRLALIEEPKQLPRFERGLRKLRESRARQKR